MMLLKSPSGLHVQVCLHRAPMLNMLHGNTISGSQYAFVCPSAKKRQMIPQLTINSTSSMMPSDRALIPTVMPGQDRNTRLQHPPQCRLPWGHGDVSLRSTVYSVKTHCKDHSGTGNTAETGRRGV